MTRALVLLLVLVGFYLFQRRLHAASSPSSETAARALADVPPLLAIVILAGLGDRLIPAAILPGFSTGWLAGMVAGVALAEPLRRTILRWYGLSSPERP